MLDIMGEKGRDKIFNFLNKGAQQSVILHPSLEIAIYTLKHPDFSYSDKTEYTLVMKTKCIWLDCDIPTYESHISALTTFKDGNTIIVKEYDSE